MNREEAKKILERIVNTYNELTHPVILTYTEMRAIKVAIEAPTAQKTGWWIRSAICQSISTGDGCGVGMGYEIFKCSCCGDERSNESNYCPNCGARMKGKEDEHSN